MASLFDAEFQSNVPLISSPHLDQGFFSDRLFFLFKYDLGSTGPREIEIKTIVLQIVLHTIQEATRIICHYLGCVHCEKFKHSNVKVTGMTDICQVYE